MILVQQMRSTRKGSVSGRSASMSGLNQEHVVASSLGHVLFGLVKDERGPNAFSVQVKIRVEVKNGKRAKLTRFDCLAEEFVQLRTRNPDRARHLDRAT